MKKIQEFNGFIGAEGVETDTLFYEQKATKGLSFVIANDTAKVVSYVGTSKHVYIPDFWGGYAVNEIDVSAFEGTAIVSVRLPKYLETIGASAFKDCTALEEIDLGEHIISIGDNAFNGCSNLFKVIIRTADLPTNEQSNLGFVQGAVLVRPAKVNDEMAWANFVVGYDFVEEIAYFNGNAETSTTSQKTMSTNFTNEDFVAYETDETTLTAGTYQMYAVVNNGIVNNTIVTSTIVYFDGAHKTSQFVPFQMNTSPYTYAIDTQFVIEIGANGDLFCTMMATEGNNHPSLFSVYYRKID